jgi:hypothetical protein
METCSARDPTKSSAQLYVSRKPRVTAHWLARGDAPLLSGEASPCICFTFRNLVLPQGLGATPFRFHKLGLDKHCDGGPVRLRILEKIYRGEFCISHRRLGRLLYRDRLARSGAGRHLVSPANRAHPGTILRVLPPSRTERTISTPDLQRRQKESHANSRRDVSAIHASLAARSRVRRFRR